jgi:AP-1 complex subunit mu
MAVTNAVSWRSEGIRYRKNEVFLDVIESVNLLVSPSLSYIYHKLCHFLPLCIGNIVLIMRQVNASGNVVRSEILGAVKMKCYLSGMPELRLGLNDKVMFETTGRSTSFNRPNGVLPFC